MKEQSFSKLIDRYIKGEASLAEQALVEAYLDKLEKGPVKLRTPEEEEQLKALIFQRVTGGRRKETGIIFSMRSNWTKGAVAAGILIFLSASLYFLLRPPKPHFVTPFNVARKDVPPGRDAAVLTLADGRKILLDSSAGPILSSNGIQVVNLRGLLSYKGHDSSNKEEFNTITTARGNQYQLELADGTRVWLNSASSLYFPIAFKGGERTVQLSGEGYFEVAKDRSKPFHVKTEQSEIEVLGTHFNINAYSDESSINTTLLEGSVKVVHAGEERLLHPGQQAQITSNGMVVREDVDVDGVVAWKNGIFLLDNTSLPALMRQISRWYDVDIVYKSSLPDTRFEGGISRKLPLSKVLELLEANGLHFTLAGKQLVVQP